MRIAAAWMLGLFAACSNSAPETKPSDPGRTGDMPSATSVCESVNRFSQAQECRQYGAGWSESDIAADCDGLGGELAQACATQSLLGQCSIAANEEQPYVVFVYGENSDGCALQKTGCENFGGGVWRSAALCAGGGGSVSNVFIQPTKICKAPLPGEAPGQSADGEVCTWESISGSTEEGRRFSDYVSCNVVYSQRPYYPAQPAPSIGRADERLLDADYKKELDWVTKQIESSGCVCCHSSLDAPAGTSNWYLEAPGNWVWSMADSGVALGANAVTSIAFGAYPAEDNNGFDRTHSGIPSTDPERMVTFFVEELRVRGKSVEDFKDTPPFGGPLHDQIFFRPEACEGGEGVQADGTILWSGGDARYLYVLERDSLSPTVPPNLDLPDGTLWRIDVAADAAPVASGRVTYGTSPDGASQRFPVGQEAPAALVPGEEYYLYASLDVGLPITRCLFVAK